MAILEKEVWVGMGHKNGDYYESKGYKIERNKEGKIKLGKLLVKVCDLQEGSNVKVTKVCDICGTQTPNTKYSDITKRRRNGDSLDRCFGCGNIFGRENKKKNISYERSLQYWAMKNNKEYLLEEFSNKNINIPLNISYATHDVYWWICKKCDNEYESSVNNRSTGGNNCPYCAGKKVNLINCLVTTHSEIAKLLTNPEVGYKITSGCGKSVEFTCPDCGNIDKKLITNVTSRGFSCSLCSDGISYAEKFMISALLQLKNLDFETQKVFKWSKKTVNGNKKLDGTKKYDFFISSLDLIIETHGKQHYIESFIDTGGKSLEEEQENDKFKEKLAKDNEVVNYVVIDCLESELEYIKNNILNSKLNQLLDLTKIDWLKCHEFACNSSLIKITCDMWNNGIKSAIKIAEELKMGRSTIRKYLKQGTLIGWCDYNLSEVNKQRGINLGRILGKPIIQLTKENEFIREFYSAKEASRILGIPQPSIWKVCNGKKKTTGGFRWIYKEDYEKILIRPLY